MWIVPEEDLEYIFTETKSLWENFNGTCVLITGGTGLFGKWLIETFLFANYKGFKVKLLILSRDPLAFIKKYPKFSTLSGGEVEFINGDVQTYSFDSKWKIDFIIHAATSASTKLNTDNPLKMLDVIINGTRNILDFGCKQKLKGFLFVSSGAVYGTESQGSIFKNEQDLFQLNLNDRNSAYAEGKRTAEFICSVYSKAYQMPMKIARCFAFVGPHLPLDSHFAIGNFIDSVLRNGPLTIKGNGSAIRSYMYMSDLVIALLNILVKGKINKAYNVGSEEYYTIKELAEIFNIEFGVPINIMNQSGTQSNSYVPDISLLKNDLNIHKILPLRISIKKTVRYYQGNGE